MNTPSPETIHVLRLMNEYCVEQPTWCAEEDLTGRFPEGLSKGLQIRLLDWAKVFIDNFDDEDRWPAGFDEVKYFEQGKELAQALANELKGKYRIKYIPMPYSMEPIIFEPNI